MRRKQFVVYNRSRRESPASSVTETAQLEPSSMSITYSTDYDILALDPIVRTFIQDHQSKSIVALEKQLTDLDSQIEACTVVMEMRELDVRRASTVSQLATLRSDAMLHKYVLTVTPLLATYRDTPLADIVLDASNRTQSHQTREELIRARTVDSYMNVVTALRLPTLTITKEKVEKIKTRACISCNSPLIGCLVLLSGQLVCSSCGVNNKPNSKSSCNKEYDSLSNVLKAHKRYVGTMTPKCDIELVKTKLDEYFLAEDEYDGEYYRQQAVDEHGRKEGTSVDGLCEALKALGFDDLYKYYMYVGHHYYGWLLPDLRYLEEAMIANFRLKQDVWDDMTDEEKGCQSNLCAEYRLCREHQHAGRDCSLSDYKISRKKRTLERYDNGYAIMCKRSGFENVFSVG